MQTDWFTLAGRAPAAEAVQRAEPRSRGGGVDLADRREGGRQARHRPAVDRRHDAPGLRRDRLALEDVERGRRATRQHRRPRELAPCRPDASRGDEGTGAQGRRVRHRAVLEVLHPRAARGSDARRHRGRDSSPTSTTKASRSSAHPTTRSRRSSRWSTSPAASGRSCCSVTTGRSPAATLHSFELFAQYVMPHFTGQLDAPAASCEWVTGSGGEFVTRAANAIMKAIADHAAEQAEQQPAG